MKSKERGQAQIIVGVDPATGASSPTGVAVVHAESKTILGTFALHASHKKLEHRIKVISEKLDEIVANYVQMATTDVYIEYFVMRGKGGEMLQRIIGSFMGRMPVDVELGFVQNTTLKKVLTGNGHATKNEVADGVAKFFKGHPVSEPHAARLIYFKQWDELDALAIAIVGMFQE